MEQIYEDELSLDGETIVVHSYWDRNDDTTKYPKNPIEFEPGDELLLGHVSPETPFRYTGTVDRNGESHFHFNTTSDFPVTELVISPAKFMLAMGDDIWYF